MCAEGCDHGTCVYVEPGKSVLIYPTDDRVREALENLLIQLAKEVRPGG